VEDRDSARAGARPPRDRERRSAPGRPAPGLGPRPGCPTGWTHRHGSPRHPTRTTSPPPPPWGGRISPRNAALPSGATTAVIGVLDQAPRPERSSAVQLPSSVARDKGQRPKAGWNSNTTVTCGRAPPITGGGGSVRPRTSDTPVPPHDRANHHPRGSWSRSFRHRRGVGAETRIVARHRCSRVP
jgi:hypothetical protein